MGKQWKEWLSLFFWAPKSLQMVAAAMKLKHAYSLEGKLWPTSIAYEKAEILSANKGPSSQGYGFSSGHVWIWELDCEESWAPKGAFELWCWRRLLRVPWTAKRSNQSILKGTSPGCSFERLMLRLKLLYFGHLLQRADSLEKTMMLGGFVV